MSTRPRTRGAFSRFTSPLYLCRLSRRRVDRTHRKSALLDYVQIAADRGLPCVSRTYKFRVIPRDLGNDQPARSAICTSVTPERPDTGIARAGYRNKPRQPML